MSMPTRLILAELAKELARFLEFAGDLLGDVDAVERLDKARTMIMPQSVEHRWGRRQSFMPFMDEVAKYYLTAFSPSVKESVRLAIPMAQKKGWIILRMRQIARLLANLPLEVRAVRQGSPPLVDGKTSATADASPRGAAGNASGPMPVNPMRQSAADPKPCPAPIYRRKAS